MSIGFGVKLRGDATVGGKIIRTMRIPCPVCQGYGLVSSERAKEVRAAIAHHLSLVAEGYGH